MRSALGTVSVVSVLTQADQIGGFAAATTDNWVRIVVRNVGPTALLIGFSTRAVAGETALTTPGNFLLAPSSQDIEIFAAPTQTVYASSIGDGGRLSFHLSLVPKLMTPEPCQ
jgi:uncharacterized membrane protein YphA (DoxX/SURF4 family)